MALFYITGTPGSGKSTIQGELGKLGYEAHDMDDDDIGGPYNIETNKRVIIPPAEHRPPEWYTTHEWRTDRIAVEALKENAKDHPIFLCGTAPDDEKVWDLFDKVLYLDIDEGTLRARIASREDNDFGKNENELQTILQRHENNKQKHAELQTTPIDATRPIKEVLNAIIDNSIK